jgi:hypothetical protein
VRVSTSIVDVGKVCMSKFVCREFTCKSIGRLIAIVFLVPALHGLCQDANPPIYSEAIPTSSGLAFNPATDIKESFEAPNGKTVEVLVKGPEGSGTLWD